MQQVLVDNKNYRIGIYLDDTLDFSEKKGLTLTLNYFYKLKTTRATRFQAKKLLRKEVNKMLWRSVEHMEKNNVRNGTGHLLDS